MAQIELQNASVVFPLRTNTGLTLKEYLTKRIFEKGQRRLVQEITALSDISLTIAEGTRIGFIGHNGAGKSTLLRTIAGVYPVSTGTRRVAGRIASLFDINLGLEPEATGLDNIYYRGYLQGETPRSIRAKIDEIANFCDLGDFLHVPMRCYSAGMSMRLAFSVATCVAADILLIDEVISVGDMAFQAKANLRMQDLIDQARILVLVAHDLNLVQSMCTEVIWLDSGRIRMRGPAAEVVAAYSDAEGTHPRALSA